jgi:hypothetical protein
MSRGDEMEIRAVFGTLKYNKNNMLWEITRCAYHWQMSAIREGKERNTSASSNISPREYSILGPK